MKGNSATMLSGIKVGKKKLKSTSTTSTAGSTSIGLEHTGSPTNDDGDDDGDDFQKQQRSVGCETQQQQRATTTTATSTGSSDNNNNNNNKAMADQLRLLLQQSSQSLDDSRDKRRHAATSTTGISSANTTRTVSQHSPHSTLLQRSEASAHGTHRNTTRTTTTTTTKTPILHHQHHQVNSTSFNYNSEGTQQRNEADMSVLELLKQEKAERSAYQHKRQLGTKRGRYHNNNNNNDDDDDDDDTFQTHLYTNNITIRSHETDDCKPISVQKESTTGSATSHSPNLQTKFNKSRMNHNTQCYWWIQSSNFASHRFIEQNRTEHVILCFASPSQSLLVYGEHFYIVPIEYTPSFSTCSDPNVWNEIRSIQSMLRSIATTLKKGVLFFETYLGSTKRVNGDIWQARIEAVFVPIDTLYDAPLYFRSALTEQAEEDGTKPNLIATNTMTKPLYHAIPKNFPYFYVEYDSLPPSVQTTTTTATTTNNGHVLVIESKQFPSTFGVDTIASMMDIEPIRMRRHRHSSEMSIVEERRVTTQFLDRYDNILNGR